MSTVQRNGTGISAEFAEKNGNTPSADTDIANKAYVDSVAQGLSPKNSVKVATAAALPAYTYANGSSGVGATITANAFGALTVDGVTGFSVGDRILVKDETAANAPYNGIYTVTAAGSGGSLFVLTRALDNNQGTEFQGAYTFTQSGTVNTGAGFVCTNTGTVTVGTTAITWTQFSGLGEVTAGAGLTKTGNTLNVGAGDGIQVDADSVTVKLDGVTLTKSGSGLKVTDSTFLPLTGGTMQGDVNFNSHNLTNVTTIDGTLGTSLGLGVMNPYWFGNGADSSLTLVADTALASGTPLKNYTNVNLAGFTLTQNSADSYIALFINGTLTMASGTITSAFIGTAGGAGGVAAANGGGGGAGGGSQGAVFVYARAISGTGTISASGRAGVAGSDAVSTPAGQVNGAGGTAGTNNASAVFGTTITLGTAPGAGAGGVGGSNTVGATGGAGGVSPTAAGANDYRLSLADAITLIQGSIFPFAMNATSKRKFVSENGAGGGAGGGNATTNKGGPGGSGGGGGASWLLSTPGGAGGDSGTSPAGGVLGGKGGGGGGAGSSGSLVVVVTTSQSGALTIKADGGAGANGGNAFTDGSGGGGGGGGAGGIAVYSGPSGPTITAAAGAGGTKGTSAGNGGASSNGNPGTAGLVYNMN